MRYAKIREMDISNGEGIGVSLFVQGCHFHCKGCFNSETWDFNGGKEWNKDIKNKFLELGKKSYIKRFSILGGEPLCDENVAEVKKLIDELNLIYPEKRIWLYTGYNCDEIISEGLRSRQGTPKLRLEVIRNVYMVVDGKFQIENQDLYNEKIIFAGSTNQRLLGSKTIKEMIKQTEEK